jgi:hypothetical protein
LLTSVAVLVISASAEGRRTLLPDGMTTYSGDFAGWSQAAPGFTTIDFTGFDLGTTIYDQYADLGVLFTSIGPPKIAYAPSALLQDGWGVDANWHTLELTFLQPMHAVAWHHNSYFMEIYSGTELIAITPFLGSPAVGQKFGGLTSTIPFDRVRIRTSTISQVWIDNIYFASAIPAPAVWMVFAAIPFGASRRRRRQTAGGVRSGAGSLVRRSPP